MRLTIQEVVDAVEGELAADENSMRKVVTGITWDSRKVGEGDIFLAMPGERVDGNDYITAAIGAGASMIVCTARPSDNLLAVAGEFACPVVVVNDGIEAITKLARYWRDQLHCVVVGVTGSTGKTSTKDLLASVLSTRYNTVATQGNNNNELGIPYTVLRADPETEVLIVEMGMRGLGQIEHGCSIAHPAIGVVTNVGVCHMELLGSREAIAHAKGEMIAALPETGLAVVNADDDMTEFMLQEADAAYKSLHIKRFGRSETADTKVSNVKLDAEGRASFDLSFGGGIAFPVELGVAGEHNISNALAAAVVGNYLGLSFEQIARGLKQAGASGMRMEVAQTASGVTIINDAYNANPDSMRAALATLASMECSGRRIAVLGDMGELGDDEVALHEQVGRDVAAANIDLLIAAGPLAAHIASAAQEAGATCAVECAADTAAAASALKQSVREGDTVLLKASRFMGFEQIVKEISE